MRFYYTRYNTNLWAINKLLLALIILMPTISCTYTKSKLHDKTEKKDSVASQVLSQHVLEVDVTKATAKEAPLLLSELSNDIRYVNLKTPIEKYLNTILSVKIYLNKIYVADNNKLLSFDLEGNFISQIGRQGRGPGEYISIRDFVIDETTSNIFIYGGNTGEILKYSQNGKFEGRSFAFNNADHVDFINDKFVFSGLASFSTRNLPNNITQYAIVDKNGTIIEKKLLPIYRIKDFRSKNLGMPGAFINTRYDNSLLLYSYGEDTIYQISTDNMIKPKYYLNFGKYTQDLKSRYLSLKQNDPNQYIVLLSSPFETKNHLFFKFALHQSSYILYYDKIKNKPFTYKYTGDEQINFLRGKNNILGLGFKNDYDCGFDFFPKWSIMHGTKQQLIAVFEPYKFKSELTAEHFISSKCKSNDKKSELMNFVKNLKENDNSVLMIVSVE